MRAALRSLWVILLASVAIFSMGVLAHAVCTLFMLGWRLS